MKLIELQPRFVRYETRIETYAVANGDHTTWRERGCPTHEVTGPRHYSEFVDSIAEAQGIWFLCPLCFQTNGGDVGTHWCEVTFANRGASDEQGSHGHDGKPTRWDMSGTNFQDLTLTPSIDLVDGCAWHGYITNGEIR